MPNTNPSEVLTAYFPQAPYNFEDYPNGTPRHLRLLFDAGGQAIRDLLTNYLIAAGFTNITQSRGFALDLHGLLAGVARGPNQLDDSYRLEILGALLEGKVSGPAIQAAVQAYYDNAQPGQPIPVVNVFDLQSNPAACAQIFYTDPATGLTTNPVKGDFVIQVLYPATAGFFLNYTYLGQADYLINSQGSVSLVAPNTDVGRLVDRIRGSGFNPIYLVGYQL